MPSARTTQSSIPTLLARTRPMRDQLFELDDPLTHYQRIALSNVVIHAARLVEEPEPRDARSRLASALTDLVDATEHAHHG